MADISLHPHLRTLEDGNVALGAFPPEVATQLQNLRWAKLIGGADGAELMLSALGKKQLAEADTIPVSIDDAGDAGALEGTPAEVTTDDVDAFIGADTDDELGDDDPPGPGPVPEDDED
jgi:hypothetical protein